MTTGVDIADQSNKIKYIFVLNKYSNINTENLTDLPTFIQTVGRSRLVLYGVPVLYNRLSDDTSNSTSNDILPEYTQLVYSDIKIDKN